MKLAERSETLPVRLRVYYLRNGCVRTPQPSRLLEGHQTYKKGWEVRLVLEDVAEVTDARRLLQRAGFGPGRPYCKGAKWIQPVYGRDAVERFAGLGILR